jgi:hypothetical protein
MKSFVGKDSYTFEIHAADYQEAYNMVMRMFDGIDMDVSLGTIIDCDTMKKYHNVNGEAFVIEKPEGYYRASPEEVAISMFKLIKELNQDYTQFLRHVNRGEEMYRKFKIDSDLAHLNEAEEGARRAKAWLGNLLKDFPSQCSKEPMREEVRQALLNAVSEINVQA